MKLPETATLAEASALLQQVGAEGVSSIDASALRQFDTSVIALLLEARRRAEQGGRPFTVTGMPPKLLDLARLYGVEALLSPAPAAAA